MTDVIKNIVTVIQARNASTRLPGKVMMPLAGKPLLLRMYERVKASGYPLTIVIAITNSPADDILYELCKENNIHCFRGDENDLLDRHYRAALEYNARVVIKIPSDCPLIDPLVIDRVIGYFLENDELDYVSNLHPATYPDGNDVEIMHMDVLRDAWKLAELPMEREHTTPFIWEHDFNYQVGNVEWETGKDYSMTHRFTIDYKEDYDFIKRVYDELYENNPRFGLNDILNLLEQKPEIMEINKQYAGVNWYRHHLHELKTISEEQTKII